MHSTFRNFWWCKEIEYRVEKRWSCWNCTWFECKDWVDSELFKGWLSDHFLAQAVGAHLLLLLLDGDGSHYQPELISYAREFGIILFCLPPHTTHESQPLDASIFKSLKQNWQHACHNFFQSNPSPAIINIDFQGCLIKYGVKPWIQQLYVQYFENVVSTHSIQMP